LIERLKKGEISKISYAKNKVVNYSSEIGNNSFRTDIFITFSKDSSELDFNKNGPSFIAIEVKIKDWVQGLYQAHRYNKFAERSYLALYSDYAKDVDLNLFKKYNVGLIVFDDNKVVVKNRPKKNTFTGDVSRLSLRKDLWEKSLAMESR